MEGPLFIQPTKTYLVTCAQAATGHGTLLRQRRGIKYNVYNPREQDNCILSLRHNNMTVVLSSLERNSISPKSYVERVGK